MRPENEWFKPEKLTVNLYLYEVLILVPLVVVVGALAFLGVFESVELWVLGLVVGPPLAVVAFVTWWIPAFYRTADYRLTDDEIEYRRGVFFQQKSTVPYDRITNVNVSQGPVERLVAAGSVGIHTAGFSGQMGAELAVSGVSDYEEIKEQILAKVQEHRPATTEAGDESAGAGAMVAAQQSLATGDELAELRRIRELLEQSFGEGAS